MTTSEGWLLASMESFSIHTPFMKKWEVWYPRTRAQQPGLWDVKREQSDKPA